MLTCYRLHDLLKCRRFFSSNYDYPYIGSIYLSQIMVTRGIVCFLGDIGHVVMLILLVKDANRSPYWWKSYSNFKYTIFDEGVIWEITFNGGRVGKFVPVMRSEPGTTLFQIYCYVHQISQVNNILISWYAGLTLSLYLCSWSNPWMINFASHHITLRWWGDGNAVILAIPWKMRWGVV